MNPEDSKMKEVDFKTYCKICKFKSKEDYEDPCNSCLEVPMREGTFKPEKWEKKPGRNGRRC